MKWSKLIFALSTASMIIFNTIATTLPLNGKTTKELSDQYPVFFTPAAYVFSIWGIIYIALLYLTWYSYTHATSKKLLWLMSLSNMLNMSWIVAWHYQQLTISVVLIVSLLLVLLTAYHQGLSEKNSQKIQPVLGLYLGWLSVATIANISVLLYANKWDGWGISGENWTIVMMSTAFTIGMIMLFKYHDYVFLGVILWALTGIGIKWGSLFQFPVFIFVLMGGLSMIVQYVKTRNNLSVQPST